MQERQQTNKYKVLLAVTGSVAAIKLNELLQLLLPTCTIKVILTHSAKKFVKLDHLDEKNMLKEVQYFVDEDEQKRWNHRGDPVLHIELRKWADALLIAPLSANTLAKISNGLCDNLVTLTARCWDMKLRELTQQSEYKRHSLIKPIIICPAMNTMMWQHPITEEQLIKLKTWGYTVVDPVEKVLMCGDQGKGAMGKLQTIVQTLLQQLRIGGQQEAKLKMEKNQFQQ